MSALITLGDALAVRDGHYPAGPLPLAALPFDNGSLCYPARPAVAGPIQAGDVIWMPSPEIPSGMPFRWATLAEADVPGLDLADPLTLALLLYASTLDPREWLITTSMLHAVVLAQAELCGCSLDRLVAQLAEDAGNRMQACAERIAWCLDLARSLLGGA